MTEILPNRKAIFTMTLAILHVAVLFSDPRLENDYVRRSFFRRLEDERTKEESKIDAKGNKHLILNIITNIIS